MDDDAIEDLKAEIIDARQLATDEDGKVRVWETASGKEAYAPLLHGAACRTVFTTDGRHVVTATDNQYRQGEILELLARHLPKAARALLQEGWRVEAQGKLYREAGDFKIEVTSGIDWFELHGGATFGDQEVPLPTLLAALRRGEDLVPLGDGSFGLLPEEWLKKYATLAGVGTP